MSYAWNVERAGYHDLEGRSGFKLALQEHNDRFYLYVGALWEPGLTILDVTDPRNIGFVRWIDGPPNTWTLQVQVADGRMITNLEPIAPGWSRESGGSPEAKGGLMVWDVEVPDDPRPLGTWTANGTHRNFYDGGRYVHAAAALPGYQGKIYAAIDIGDPTRPEMVGKWWYSGQHVAGGEQFTPEEERRRRSGKPQPGEAFSLHGGAYRSGTRLYCPWSRGGMIVLDIADITDPREVSRLSVYPPLGSSIALHTAVPLVERGLVIVNDEALNDRRQEPLNFAGLVDISDESDPTLVSIFPVPDPPPGLDEAYWDRGGRFGPHNQHQPQGQSGLLPSGDLVYLTYFNAGLQIFDITNARRPRIAGYYIPDEPESRRGPKPADLVTQVEDVLVDRRGNVFISEKNTGITALRLSGELADRA